MKKFLLFIAIVAIGAVAVLYMNNTPQNQLAEPVAEPAQEVAQEEVASANLAEAEVEPETPAVPTTSRAVLLTMDEVSSARNQIWVGVFQLVWNDLMDKLNKAPITFAPPELPVVFSLNQRPFKEDDLSKDSYYTKLGLVSLALRQEIEEAIFAKFHEKSRILDGFNWTPEPEKYFLYAMLKKDLEYVEQFDDLGNDVFTGSTQNVKYFGVTSSGSSPAKDSIRVLFYNNENDFAVTLKSKQGDLIHLYRTDRQGTLEELYNAMKQQTVATAGSLRGGDEFKAPKLDFGLQQEFPELCGRPMAPSGFIISKALEAIQFKMDEKGATLESEVKMVALRAMSVQSEKRKFYVTGPYALFLEETGKRPYFAAHITDVSMLQKI